MFQVQTYQNPKTYYANLKLEADALHITGDSSFLLHLKRSNPDIIHPSLFTYDKLQHKLFPGWHSPFTNLLIKTKIREKFYSLFPEDKEILKDTLDKWVMGIRLLVEMNLMDGTEPRDQQNKEQIMFYQIWRELQRDSQLKKIFAARHSTKIIPALRNVIDRHQIKAIYVYHMIQLTASRVMFLTKCAESGIPVIFRIPYEPALPHVYKPWIDVYQVLVPLSEWKHQQEMSIPRNGSRFASYLEGNNRIDTDDVSIDFLKFMSPVHFQRYMQDNPMDYNRRRYVIYRNDKVRKLFRQGVKQPDDQTENDYPLSQLPCNRFFSYFYKFKHKNDTIYLEYDELMECMSSGWIKTKDTNGIYTETLLMDLEPYMKGISTIDEVLDRLTNLIELNEESAQFDELVKDKSNRSKVKRYLTNPFRVFPYVHRNRSRVTLKQLQALCIALKKLATTLLPPEDTEMSVQKHLDHLYQLFQRVEAELFLTPGDRNRMAHVFSSKQFVTWNGNRQEIEEIVATLLNIAHPKEGNNHYKEVDNLDQLEGLTLQMEEMHVTGLSMQMVEKYGVELNIEPLTFEWLKYWAYYDAQKGRVSYQKMTKALHTHFVLNQLKNAYLDFQIYYVLAFAEGKLTFSWIDGLHEHDGESGIFNTLFLLYSKEVVPPNWVQEATTVSFTKEEEIPAIDTHKAAQKLLGQIPVVNWLDQDFCSRKFFWNTIVESHPIYESDFHQQIVFSTLSSMFAGQAMGLEAVTHHLFPLFPQWTPTLKKNLMNIAYRSGVFAYRSFQNVSYPKAMERLQRLYSRNQVTKRYRIKNAYNKDRNDDSRWIKEFAQTIKQTDVEAEPGEHCTMCPYLMICEKGEFSIDRKYSG
ncbi:PD-(D/E)XK nuclease family protein [Shimazuella alba]|uniref:PD-(D/E)XK endonuclease-like domain-containing protein n=1 Tax=Shimazuella alba TaxID=2690964 RepID=A0A6I4W3A2_9BACL|nr:PD-(D/E)XK nuclease family protein [Shimazuella alba]MXQ54772.1 hypothetical protein [Shimazuella alba]